MMIELELVGHCAICAGPLEALNFMLNKQHYAKWLSEFFVLGRNPDKDGMNRY
jgi:hypothetical protein